MNNIYSWVKNIVYFLLLVKIMEYMIPSEKSGKYIKLFSGIVLIIILIQPFLKILNWDGKINASIINISNKIDNEQLLNNKQQYLDLNDDISIKVYKNNIIDRISYILENEGYKPLSVDVELEDRVDNKDYGSIKKLFVSISMKTSNKKNEESININKVEIDKIKLSKENNNAEEKVKSSEDILIEKKIKNIIINFYNLSSDNIHITIE